MDLLVAQNIFAVRLYEWSQRDFIRELEEGCPLLSTLGLNNRDVAAFVAWNEILSSQQRMALAIALTRRMHENARKLKREVLTAVDDQWFKVRYQKITAFRDREIAPLRSANVDILGFQPSDPDQCLEFLVKFASSRLGGIRRLKSKVICTKKLGDWRVITEFTFRRRERFLTFEYQFKRKDSETVDNVHPAQGPFPRTMLLFYGLYTSSVMVPSRTDCMPMAKVMVNLAEYFVDRADVLFEGLGIND